MQFSGTFGKTEISILDVYGAHTGNCGYCDLEKTKTKQTSTSFGFSCGKYNSNLYEQMMFRGWRRCGDYTYKFDLNKTCCKAYTCRLNIEEFKMNKKQRQVMRRFRKYLTGELEEELANKHLSTEKTQEVKNKEINDNYLKEINAIVSKYIMEVTSGLADFLGTATEYQPIVMGIVIAVLMGMALTAPISSAAIAAIVFGAYFSVVIRP